MVLLSTAVAVCGSFEFGTCVGYSAPAQAGIVGDIGLSNSQIAICDLYVHFPREKFLTVRPISGLRRCQSRESTSELKLPLLAPPASSYHFSIMAGEKDLPKYGIFASVLTVGAMVGALTSGRLADTLGRKMTMRLAAIVGIFGWLAIYLAKHQRVSEEALQPQTRLERAGQCARNVRKGCSAAYIIGATISWRSLVIVGLVPCVFLLVGLPFIPESPRWLANIGREKEFRASLQKLRGEKADISGEATEIIVCFFPKLLRLSTYNLGKRIFQKTISYSYAGVGVGLKVFQQLGGINALGFYTSYIFSSAGFSGKLGTTLIGIIQIPITLLGALLMDRSGRRTLLLVSSSGTFVGCFLTGLSFYFKAQGLYTQLVPTLALYGILAYYVAYSIGMGPVPWVIMSEIFSINMKGIAGSLVTLVSWVGSFVISYSFSFLMDWNSAGTFFLFSAASLVTVLFVARLVPETKGRTLEEIQESLMAGT
uniref:Sugar transporter ERD6-like 16 n=1 Tax=Aegilops tauschii TaxID=37682 RepID=M8AM12_AEGTA